MNNEGTDLSLVRKVELMKTKHGENVRVVKYEDGKREISLPDQENSVLLTLDAEEAAQFSSLIGDAGHKPRSLKNIESVVDGLYIELYKLERHYKAVGKTIGDLRLRQRSMATIIAVIENNYSKHISPGPDLLLKAEATVIILGERLHQHQAKHILEQG